jgi:hypothetical protein
MVALIAFSVAGDFPIETTWRSRRRLFADAHYAAMFAIAHLAAGQMGSSLAKGRFISGTNVFSFHIHRKVT